MKPVFVDLHIHTSNDPNSLNENYDVETLLSKVKEISLDNFYLISLTDHNTINKSAYIKLLEKASNVILGSELHIRNYKDKPPYHCHIYFDFENITVDKIDSINDILNELYPNKVIDGNSDFDINIEDVIRGFDGYDFILLPHGGQNHRQFHKSISTAGSRRFDNILERNIYYNQFDGFTARNETGLHDTIEYFTRLGINEFINLLTCTDNYNPQLYPQAKASNASEFIPTWMFSRPTFNGLRLALSESSRLVYSTNCPIKWAEYIQEVKLSNEKIDIDLTLTPGLNVVIGGSSSGKTLLVDSVFKKLSGSIDKSIYKAFDVAEIDVRNPSGLVPHYIDQNYIIELINDNSEKGIDDIPIIKKVFPCNKIILDTARLGLATLKADLDLLIDSVQQIEQLQSDFKQIPVISRLIQNEKVASNYFKLLLPKEDLTKHINFPVPTYNFYKKSINDIKNFLINNPFSEITSADFDNIENEIEKVFEISVKEIEVRKKIGEYKSSFDLNLSIENQKAQSKQNNYENLLKKISNYKEHLNTFKTTINKISEYSINCSSEMKEIMNHKLYIENNFTLTRNKFLEVLNIYLKADFRISQFDEIAPENLFESKFMKRNPKVRNYDDFKQKINYEFTKLNKIKYKIITSNGKEFDELSAGWKTSIILDLLLGYKEDIAPLIIDQPEDNLATHYINHGLIKAIKDIKNHKQIILVSHNATIPMLGDAQNVILCKNYDKIVIRSDALEGRINDKYIVDYIAEITDGGKPSIKKRVKKYNLKNYRG